MTTTNYNMKTALNRFRVISVLIGVLVLSAMLLYQSPRSAPEGFNVLCTFLPVYVFTTNVVGDTPGVHVELLVSPDSGCPHSYNPRASDLKRVADADLILANGLGLEPFLDRLQRDKPGKVLTVSGDCDLLPSRNAHDEHAEHEDADEHAGHQHAPGEACTEPHAHSNGAYNPHVWVSPREAVKQVRSIAAHLATADPAHADAYRKNADAYVARLEALNARLEAISAGVQRREIVTFHEAFDYLARDMHLNVVATLAGLPEEGTSARRMADVIRTIRQSKAAAVFYEPVYSDRLARTVAHDAGVPTYPLNPFNSVQGKPSRDSYEQVMDENLRTLQRALGGPTSAPASQP